mmetsp:Transcript_22248/g.41735  ORF Transcript_22248/g.41735 Transcript_22248/m.41735 type:complete len:88 (+) Transcript_22248:35-298(+)
MELEAFSTLDDSSILCLVDIFFALEKAEAVTRRNGIKKFLVSLKLPRHGKLSREIRSCFDKEKRFYSSTERLGMFVSAASFAFNKSH